MKITTRNLDMKKRIIGDFANYRERAKQLF
jgi:hypothetical protein